MYYSLKSLIEKGRYDSKYQDILKESLCSLSCLPILGIKGELICCNRGYLNKQITKVKNTYRSTKVNSRGINIEDCLSSAVIEGARTTVEEVKKSLGKGYASISKSDRMVINVVNVLNNLSTSLSEPSLIKEWRVIVDGVCENENIKGSKYRSGSVCVRSESRVVHECASVDRVQPCMASLFEYLKSNKDCCILKAVISHFYIVYVHPFCDGNGRLARYMVLKVLYQYGYENFSKMPIITLLKENVQKYYRSIESSEYRVKYRGREIIDITPHLIFMLKILECSLIRYQQLSVELSDNERRVLSSMKKRGIGTEISVKKCSNLLSCTEEESRMVLNNLYKNGMLDKRKEGRINIYTLWKI